jgi:hypothetical protein
MCERVSGSMLLQDANETAMIGNDSVIDAVISMGSVQIGSGSKIGQLCAHRNVYLGKDIEIHDWSIFSYLGDIAFDEMPSLRHVYNSSPSPTRFGIDPNGLLSTETEDKKGELYTTLLNKKLYQTILRTTGLDPLRITDL